MIVTKRLGDYQYGDTVPTGILASVTGIYTFEYEILGMTHSVTKSVTVGDELTFTNGLNEIAVCKFRIKLPAAVQDTDINYVTTPHGEVVFEYRNIL